MRFGLAVLLKFQIPLKVIVVLHVCHQVLDLRKAKIRNIVFEPGSQRLRAAVWEIGISDLPNDVLFIIRIAAAHVIVDDQILYRAVVLGVLEPDNVLIDNGLYLLQQ